MLHMRLKKKNLVGGFNRYRLLITLGLAVLLPAAALIFVNFLQLRHFQRDKVLEATIHRDFQEMLAISEKKIDKKAIAMAEEARGHIPKPDLSVPEKKKRLNALPVATPGGRK